MALNTVQSHNGVPILEGPESILLSFNNVALTFQDMKPPPQAFQGKNNGKVFLTQQRVIFIPSTQSKPLKSFSMPFYLMEGCSIEQGVFAANYIKGKVHAQPEGGWEGTATFKMRFYSGGAIDFGKAMINVATHVSRNPSAYSPVIYAFETVSVMPPRRRFGLRYLAATAPQFSYVSGPPPPAGGYYAPAPPVYAHYGPPTPSYFGSTQPPPNFAAAGSAGMPPTNNYFAPQTGYTQSPPMTSAVGYYPPAPQTMNRFSSPLPSTEQPIPGTSAAGISSDFNPSISSIPNSYASPLSSGFELPQQGTPKTPVQVPVPAHKH